MLLSGGEDLKRAKMFDGRQLPETLYAVICILELPCHIPTYIMPHHLLHCEAYIISFTRDHFQTVPQRTDEFSFAHFSCEKPRLDSCLTELAFVSCQSFASGVLQAPQRFSTNLWPKARNLVNLKTRLLIKPCWCSLTKTSVQEADGKIESLTFGHVDRKGHEHSQMKLGTWIRSNPVDPP